MSRYRKKPIVVDAFQWGVDEVPSWWKEVKDTVVRPSTGSVLIPTLERLHEAQLNDFIIRGITGKIYPCKPDIFKETYEEVPDDDQQTR